MSSNPRPSLNGTGSYTNGASASTRPALQTAISNSSAAAPHQSQQQGGGATASSRSSTVPAVPTNGSSSINGSSSSSAHSTPTLSSGAMLGQQQAGHQSAAVCAAAAPSTADAAGVGPASSSVVATGTHPHHGFSSQGGTSGAAALNTELRAKARREREAKREKSREKLPHSHHHHANQAQPQHVSNAAASTATTVTRERTSSSASVHIASERKISPKLGMKPATVVGVSTMNGLRQQHGAAHRVAGSNRQQANVGPSIDMHAVLAQHLHDAAMPPALSPALSSGCLPDGLPSLQGIEGLLARVPSPPNADDDGAEQTMTQSTLFVKQYYALLEKCQGWQRYATTMKTRADQLEIENQYLRETSRKQEDDVRGLEEQMRGLKQTTMMLEDERRRRSDSVSQQDHTQSRRAPPRPAHRRSGSSVMQIGVPSPPSMAAAYQHVQYDHGTSYNSTADQHVGHHIAAIAGSELHSNDYQHEKSHDRQPSAGPYEMHDRYAQIAQGHAHAQLHTHVVQAHLHAHARHDSHFDMLAQDAAHRDAAAYHENRPMRRLGALGITESHSFPPSETVPSTTLATQQLAAAGHRERQKTTTTMSRLPSSTSAPTLRPAAQSDNGMVTSPTLAAKQRTLQHQASEGGSGGRLANAGGTKRYELHHSSDETRANGPLDGKNMLAVHGQPSTTQRLSAPPPQTSTQQDGRLSTVPGSRSGSVQSDAMTVTEDYLQRIVEQKRQLRKVSLSQQQQLHHLQARVHAGSGSSNGGGGVTRPQSSLGHHPIMASEGKENRPLPSSSSSSAHLSSGGLGNGGVSSRPSSRLSNRGVRSKMRSRAGSYSFHDAIPIDKDDVFSSQQLSGDLSAPQRTLARAESAAPLGQVTLNGRSGAASALELRHYVGDRVSDSDVSYDGEEEARSGTIAAAAAASEHARVSRESSLESIGQHATPFSANAVAAAADQGEADNDPKGAHRRLYVRLRDELATPELVRFERYVHKYDALQIEMEGPKGIINRVRRLLLPDDVVRGKQSQAERYRARKELAREFERIVREDAVPSEGSTLDGLSADVQQQQQQQQQLVAVGGSPL